MSSFEMGMAKWQMRTNMKLRRRIYNALIFADQAGAKLEEAIQDLYFQHKKDSPKHPITLALGEWLKGMRKERTFSDVIKGWLPENEILLINASGTKIDESLSQCLIQMDSQKKIKGIIVKGTAVPAILLLVMILIALTFSYVLIPALLNSIPSGATFNGVGGVLKSVTEFVRDWLVLILVIVGGIVFLISYTLPRWTGKLRGRFDSFGPWSIYRTQAGVSWVNGLNALLKHGVKLEEAIKQLNALSSPWLKERGMIILQNLHNNKDFGKSLEDSPYSFPDKDIVMDLSTANKYQGLEKALDLVAKRWLKESIETMNFKFIVINILLTIFMILIIIFFAFGMFDLLNQAQDIQKYGIGGS